MFTDTSSCGHCLSTIKDKENDSQFVTQILNSYISLKVIIHPSFDCFIHILTPDINLWIVLANSWTVDDCLSLFGHIGPCYYYSLTVAQIQFVPVVASCLSMKFDLFFFANHILSQFLSISQSAHFITAIACTIDCSRDFSCNCTFEDY